MLYLQLSMKKGVSFSMFLLDFSVLSSVNCEDICFSFLILFMDYGGRIVIPDHFGHTR